MLYSTSLTPPIFGLRREIDRLFDDAFTGRGDRATWAPSVNVRESNNELTFEFELPGMKADQVDITCDNGVLTGAARVRSPGSRGHPPTSSAATARTRRRNAARWRRAARGDDER